MSILVHDGGEPNPFESAYNGVVKANPTGINQYTYGGHASPQSAHASGQRPTRIPTSEVKVGDIMVHDANNPYAKPSYSRISKVEHHANGKQTITRHAIRPDGSVPLRDAPGSPSHGKPHYYAQTHSIDHHMDVMRASNRASNGRSGVHTQTLDGGKRR
jgi:hypothetical protein